MLQSMLIPAVLYAVMLFLPGYLCLRCVRLPRAYSLCCAPIMSTALVGILSVLYAKLHIDATPASVYLPPVCLAAAGLVLHQLQARRSGTEGEPEGAAAIISFPVIEWWMPLLFAFFGTLICYDLFVSELPSLNAVMQYYDVQHHLNATQAFVDSKRISSLGVSFYLSDADKLITPFGSPSFYPAVWYGQCALLAMATGLLTPAALNVSLAVTLALAYPLGMCALAASVFGERKRAIAFCAITCVSFVMFPWCMLAFGPLYPNLVGFALMPGCVTLCLHAFLSTSSKRSIALAWLIAIISLVGQALLHPNTLFSAFLILVPFVVQLIYTSTQQRGWKLSRTAAACAGFLFVCLAFWTVCFKSPLFEAAIREYWGRYAYPWQEIINILTQIYTLFFFTETAAQVLLGAIVVIGWIRNVYDNDTRWLAGSYLLMCVISFVNATTTHDTLKRFLAGFWYTDAMRVTAMTVIVATLVAAFGLDWVYTQVLQLLDAYNARLGRTTHPRIAATVVTCLFLVINFMPGFNWPGAHSDLTDDIVEYRIKGKEYDTMTVKTTFGDYKRKVRSAYNNTSALDVHETDFLKDVKDIVGSDLVINDPYDGSTLAYGVYGIRTYYRKAHGFDGPSETDQSKLIRKGLYNLASDAGVQKAVDDIDARWVLVLDATYSESSFLRMRSVVTDDSYDGIAHVTLETPGFTEVLASGACHLYRIDERPSA